MPRQANGIDFWRGFALVTIFINHVPGIYFERFTHRNYSISDSADLFVFLAGWSIYLVAGRPDHAASMRQLMHRMFGRALKLYAAQILIITIAIAMLALAATLLRNPLLLEWHNAGPVFFDPIHTHIGMALLTHQLGYFDILPLYVVLLAVAPGIALIDRVAPRLLLPLSFALYAVALAFRITVPTWPVAGNWFFNPLAWQFIFVLGYLLAKPTGIGGAVRRHIRWLRIAAIPMVILGALIVIFNWWPDPTKVPEPRLFFIVDKSYLTPLRLIQFLAVVAVFSLVFAHLPRFFGPVTRFFSILGRNSLPVFCVGSLLSLAGQIARFVSKGHVGADLLVVTIGIALLGITAWLSEWRETKQVPARA